ncbi:MAG: tripartite tricarboxylate transporter TctB family protein [Pseudomonadota bacterium]
MLTKNRIGGVLLLAFCLAYALLIGDIRLLPFQEGQAFTARTMPTALSILGIALALLTIVLPHEKDGLGMKGAAWGRTVAFLVLMSIYGLAIRPAGFLIATSLFLMIGFALLGERRVWLLAIVALPIVVSFWVLMTQVLDVYIAPWPAALS